MAPACCGSLLRERGVPGHVQARALWHPWESWSQRFAWKRWARRSEGRQRGSRYSPTAASSCPSLCPCTPLAFLTQSSPTCSPLLHSPTHTQETLRACSMPGSERGAGGPAAPASRASSSSGAGWLSASISDTGPLSGVQVFLLQMIGMMDPRHTGLWEDLVALSNSAGER